MQPTAINAVSDLSNFAKLYADLLERSITAASESGAAAARAQLDVACFAAFEYSSREGEPPRTRLDRALAIFDGALARVAATGGGACSAVARELLFEARARFLAFLARAGQGGFRPADTRESLEQALRESPSHTGFLCRYAHGEARARIENRLRLQLEGALA
ncbi:hypothetical protein HK405_015475, partial [Cladochytrium tenue]